jgi:peptidoglycan/LPS O-acetylase OafA/YrhL
VVYKQLKNNRVGCFMKRLNYIDGLKGWCAVSVCILHFLLMFAVGGYIGWKCLPEAVSDPFTYYFKWFPYSILSNNSFPLYIFFALIAFIVSHTFLQNKNEDKLKQKIVLRYFRFLPLVLVACFVAYLLLAFKLCPLQAFYDITGNTWGYARLEESYSLFDMLKIGFFTAFFEGTQLVSPFWCLHYIFLGSILSFLMMLLYTKVNNKAFLFGAAMLFLYFTDQNYLAFIIGLIAGVVANNEYSVRKAIGVLLVAVGCVLGLFPPVLLPGFLNIVTFYALGAGFVIVGVHFCFRDHRLLCNKFAKFLGKESLALIVWQFLVMQSLNIFLYNCFYSAGMDEPINIALNFAVNMGFSLLLTWVSSKTITPLTNAICNRLSASLWKHTA